MEQEAGWKDIIELILKGKIDARAVSIIKSIGLMVSATVVPLGIAWLHYYYKECIEREKCM